MFKTSIVSANRRFIFLAEPSATKNEGRCLQVSNTDQLTLWHHRYGHLGYKGLCHRYGHLGYKGLCTLKNKDMVNGLPQIIASNTTSEACMKDKQQQTSYPKMGKGRETEKLGLVHAGLCGLISPASSSPKKYLLCFIDNFSRKVWSYFLVEKSEHLIISNVSK